MTDMHRKTIRTHLMQTLAVLAEQEEGEAFVLENCPDETDFASQLTRQGVSLAMHRRRSARIVELETALRRLSETDFGVCEECGGPIGLARLKANPSARLCVRCQSALEDGLNRCA
ncbi:MAG: TraR/DksA family transcriptional regulator [Pseudodesulfovibrio sp.]